MAWGLEEYAAMHGVKYNSPNKKKKKETEKPKQPPVDFTGNIYQRKGVSAILPETVAPSPWKRLPAAGGIGLLKGTMDLADKINILNYAPTGGQVDVEGFKVYDPLIGD